MSNPSDSADDEGTVTGSLERYAEVAALVRHFARKRSEVLERAGVRVSEFLAAERHWTKAMASSAAEGDNALLQVFGGRFAEVRNRWKVSGEPIEAIGRLRSVDDDESPPTRREDPGALLGTPAASASDGPPVADFAKPSYLLVDSAIDARRQTTPASTLAAPVTGIELTLTPEAGSREGPTVSTGARPKSVRRAYHPVATEDLPRPEELERLIREAEPKAALKRVASSTAGGQPTSAPRTDSSAPGFDDSSFPPSGADETLMLPMARVAAPPATGTFRDAMSPTVIPTMSVADYARFRASLRVHGEDDPKTLRAFGIASAAAKEALQADFAARFLATPKVQTEFLAFFERYLRDLNSGQP